MKNLEQAWNTFQNSTTRFGHLVPSGISYRKNLERLRLSSLISIARTFPSFFFQVPFCTRYTTYVVEKPFRGGLLENVTPPKRSLKFLIFLIAHICQISDLNVSACELDIYYVVAVVVPAVFQCFEFECFLPDRVNGLGFSTTTACRWRLTSFYMSTHSPSFTTLFFFVWKEVH